jgi:putative phosphoribosyl transferase
LGLPFGGVPFTYEVAKKLNAPLDVFIVRKLGVPSQPELAIGAIVSGFIKVMKNNVVCRLGVLAQQVEKIAEQ